MTGQADIAAYDNEGKLALVVEVKNKVGTDSEWAARMRRNILTHGLLPSVRFFLLALPDRFYLWKDKLLQHIEKPSYEINPAPFLKSYLEKVSVNPENLSNEGFQLLIISWLKLLQTRELSETLRQDSQRLF